MYSKSGAFLDVACEIKMNRKFNIINILNNIIYYNAMDIACEIQWICDCLTKAIYLNIACDFIDLCPFCVHRSNLINLIIKFMI
jgi:hypothetical protein